MVDQLDTVAMVGGLWTIDDGTRQLGVVAYMPKYMTPSADNYTAYRHADSQHETFHQLQDAQKWITEVPALGYRSLPRPEEFYGNPGNDEYIPHTDPEDAIAEYLEFGPATDWPRTVTITRYVTPAITTEALYEQAVTVLLEDLDTEVGDPEGGGSEPSELMNMAAKLFVSAVLAEYDVWALVATDSTEWDVAAFVKESRPGWLEEDLELPKWWDPDNS